MIFHDKPDLSKLQKCHKSFLSIHLKIHERNSDAALRNRFRSYLFLALASILTERRVLQYLLTNSTKTKGHSVKTFIPTKTYVMNVRAEKSTEFINSPENHSFKATAKSNHYATSFIPGFAIFFSASTRVQKFSITLIRRNIKPYVSFL